MTAFGIPWQGSEFAREAEEAGITAFCTGEFVDHDAYVTTAEMALTTERALVGPAIAYGFSRTPFAHAASVRTLWSQAPDRVFIGLGSGAFKINRDWCGVESDRPVGRMSDLIRAIRAWLHAENGDHIRYDGEFYHIDAKVQAPVLGRIDAPILLAGFNKLMAAAAGRVADGVVGHGLFTRRWWDDIVRPGVERGFGKSENQATPLEYGWLLTAINDEDPDRAVHDLRRMIAFYLTVKTYDPYVEHHGWVSQVEKIREAFAAGRTDDMAEAVTDDMVEQIGIAGTTSDARAALLARGDSIARDVTFLAPPSFLVSQRRRREYARASLALVSGD